MAAVAVRVPKPKMTMSAVQGKIVVLADDGERIGQWGGTECFLSRQTGLGPCLVVRSSRHKKHEGTFFQLARLQRVLSTHVAEGKLTVVVLHERRQCSVYVETTNDVDELRMMAGVLQDKSRWKDIERNIASKANRGPRRSVGEAIGSSGVRGSTGLRDPLRAPLSGRGAGIEEDESEDDATGSDDDVNTPEGKTVNVTNPSGNGVGKMPPRSIGSLTTARPTAETAQSVFDTSAEVSVTPNVASVSIAQSLTSEQRRAIQLLRGGHNIFVTGAAGTGKSAWLLYTLQHVLSTRADDDGEEEEGRVAVTAATGAAARLLGGHSIHSFAGIGSGEGDPEVVLHRVQGRSDVVRAWQRCEVLVMDAVGLLPAHTFALLDRIARVLRAPLPAASPGQRANNAALPFGGLQLLVVGDFLQLPPVSRGAGEEAQPAFTSAAWKSCQFKTVVFTKDFLHASDTKFIQCCADVRRGMCTPLVKEVLTPCVSQQLDRRFGVEATAIMARRSDVEHTNAQRLDQLGPVAAQRYTSEDYATIPGADIDSEVPLPPFITLKVGAQVILLASLPGTPHVSNGDVGVVLDFIAQSHGPALPLVRFTTSAETVVVPQVSVEVRGSDGRLALSRRQMPLQLAWALTVQSVHGLTLPMVRLALDTSFAETGQAYVALSRVRCARDLCLTSFDASVIARVSSAARDFYDDLSQLKGEAVSASSAAAADSGSRRRARSNDSDDHNGSVCSAQAGEGPWSTVTRTELPR